MLVLPLTPTSPTLDLELNCASRFATLPAKMVMSSFEPPSSPSIFTATTMKQTRSPTDSSKRPKLSLQTSSLPITFGKSTTALAIAASSLPATSPTVLNTFNNAYDIPHRFSPATPSPTGSRPTRPASRLVSPFVSSKEDRPYQLSHGLRGILRNTPIPSTLRRSSICHPADSPRSARRTFFPAAKKVTFRVVLEEVIDTKLYTAKHSDLSSDEEEAETHDQVSDPSSSSSDSEPDDTPVDDVTTSGSQSRKRKARSNRQVEAAAIRDGLDSADRLRKRLRRTGDGKRKRKRRQWEWTLGPLRETSPPKESGPALTTTSSSKSPTPPASPAQVPLSPSATLPTPKPDAE